MAEFQVEPGRCRTRGPPLYRVSVPPPMEEAYSLRVAATMGLEADVLAVITRIQTQAEGHMVPFRWETRHIRPQRAAGQSLPGAPPVATHCIDLIVQDGADEARQYTLQIFSELRSSLAQIAGISDGAGANVSVGMHHDPAHAGQWCVSWDTQELRQAVHVPLPAKSRTVARAVGR